MATNNKGDKDVSRLKSIAQGKDSEIDKAEENGSEEMVDEASRTNMKKLDISEEDQKKLMGQVSKEFEFATAELKNWIEINLKRLKLYNNQTRDEKFLGEPLLYSHMDTWLSALFNDRMDYVFVPRESGDIPTAENITHLADYDYELMGMDEIFRDQDWDAEFFSYGLIDMLEFDYVNKCPAPYVLDPMTFYYDTLASNVDGNVSGKGAMRFLGWSMFMSKAEVEENPILGEEAWDKIKENWEKDKQDIGKSRARKERVIAMGGSYEELGEDMGDNTVHELITWRTNWNGMKINAIITPDAKEYVGACELPKDDDKKAKKKKTWWVVAKKYSPIPKQFKGVSIPDLVEDKQRHKAIIVNDMLKLGRATVFGSYGFDKNKIDNNVDLAFGYDKWIPVNGDPNSAISPIKKDVPFTGLLDNILNYIDVSAQKATATSELQQGVLSKDNRTASELNLVAQMTQNRYSLVAKSFAQGDRDFWRLWYMSYKLNFRNGLSEKIIRISGANGIEFKPLKREDIICKVDPNIKVDSVELTRAKRQREFAMFSEVFKVLIKDPEADKRAGFRHLMYLSGLERETIDTILPLTSDELIAYDQNKALNKGEVPPMLPNDNHLVHIRVHKEAMDSKEKYNHIMAHYEALRKIQGKPELGAPAQAGMQTGEVAPAGAGGMVGNPASPVPVTSPSQQANISNTR